MEIIRLEYPLSKIELPPLSIALGFFDGVHRGHQEVILNAKEEGDKRGLKSAVMTFFPHPKEVLRKKKGVKYLTTIRKKEQLIQQLGIDYMFIVEFDQAFSELTPQQFVDQYLIDINVKHVVAGFDYTYGRLGKGTMETFPFHARDKLSFTTIDKIEEDGQKISSTAIRSYLEQGKIQQANHFLGWSYEIEGLVVHGEQRGREIGFPTANVQTEKQTFIPNSGVYIVRILVDNVWYDGVCNIGYKPTFHEIENREQVIEVHILNFNNNIYGKTVVIQWLKKIRNEIKFISLEELKGQIANDVMHALEYFQSKV
ncbi:riboflavin biosynthesis protein RibF [Evansella sp. AB-P1]|uniref:riboflavin biosynthesis protein RibF n=1 Tax=Evansella sp. AB-P1 TaxID=3037653 RepID=UPI00241E44DA|nr:riboflavin biosynthesis protein RibF [Evansella sp. AB-P1]MDG5788996.1 riboflavin biosynthesis protein RibF [Evansella sp. AB-P1]